MKEAIDARPVDAVLPKVSELVNRYRARCLWFLDADYYPRTHAEVLQVLEYLERYGDRDAFISAASIRQWLLPGSSEKSAGS